MCVCVCVCIYVFSGIRKIDFVTTMSGQKVMMKVTLYLISFVLSTTYLVPHPFLFLTFCPSLSLCLSLSLSVSSSLSLLSHSLSLHLSPSFSPTLSSSLSIYIYYLRLNQPFPLSDNPSITIAAMSLDPKKANKGQHTTVIEFIHIDSLHYITFIPPS